MKIISYVGLILLLILGCSNYNQTSLLERTENFRISECKEDCGIDSVGIRVNKIKDGNLVARLGYIVNCEWEQGYLKNVVDKNDTLFIELDRPHEIDTISIDSSTIVTEETYVLADCDCFFYFDFTIKNFNKVPKHIRISESSGERIFWDEITPKEIFDVEEIVNNPQLSGDAKQKEYITSLSELKLKRDSIQTYQAVKNNIKKEKLNLKNKELSTDSLATLFKLQLTNRILPFWEGTEWSFEGHTSIPGEGKIACGYFVSTTLQHLGVNLNRYRLAQQSPLNEAKSLALNTKVIEIHENSKKENIAKMYSVLKDGIHFIGFDFSHVGYILKENEQLYLIHSNYIDFKGVEIEKLEESEVFASYNRYYLAALSTNEKLLESWVNGNEIKVISE